MNDSGFKRIRIFFWAGIFLSSIAMMAFEINLTRLFSITQYYHFAFMIVSLALFGFGLSGTFLAVIPYAGRTSPLLSTGFIFLAQAGAILGSYLFTNRLPFDSFTIAWDFHQVVIFIGQWLALSSVFFLNGLAVGFWLASYSSKAGTTYAVNLLGSAGGCLLALLLPSTISGEGIVTAACFLSSLAGLTCLLPGLADKTRTVRSRRYSWALLVIPGIFLFSFSAFDLYSRITGRGILSFLQLELSPYKSLSYALQYPGSQVVFEKWNAFSRVDVVQSPGIRSLPGLSFSYTGDIPAQDALFIDGDDLSPILRPGTNLEALDYLPTVLAYHLLPQANVLILEPRGGLDLMIAMTEGARYITAVEVNLLVVDASRNSYTNASIKIVNETDRGFLQHSNTQYDIIQLSLVNNFHPVTSGAYSLIEDYRYTVESFTEIYQHLRPNGIFMIMRWLQNPPSECLKTYATALTAVEKAGGKPSQQIIAFRSYNTITILVKKSQFLPGELATVRKFTADRSLDLVIAPGLQEVETNRYNILPESIYYRAFNALLAARNREDFYRSYPLNVRPATDNYPFFGYFFKIGQARQILANLGKSWQPFGGAGYFVVIFLLLLTILLAFFFVLLPLWLIPSVPPTQPASIKSAFSSKFRVFLFFGCLGFAYLLVEIPLLQRFILYLGQPSYAMTGVLFSLLFFSGIGSQVSSRVNLNIAMVCLIVVLVLTTLTLPFFFQATLGQPLSLRLIFTGLLLSSLGFLMGIPFPSAIQRIKAQVDPALIPWAWGINGAASVVAAILAAWLALTIGLNGVFWAGAFCYAIAWGIVSELRLKALVSRLPR